MKVLGIDPGLNGYLFGLELFKQIHVRLMVPMPVVKVTKKGRRQLNWKVLKETILAFDPDIIAIERQTVFKKDGRGSGLTTMKNFGILLGMSYMTNAQVIEITPRTWQKFAHQDVSGDDPKGRSVLAAQRYFPNIDFKKSARAKNICVDKCEAALIAWYTILNYKATR